MFILQFVNTECDVVGDRDNLVKTDVRAGIGDDLVEFCSRYSRTGGKLVRNVRKRYQGKGRFQS